MNIWDLVESLHGVNWGEDDVLEGVGARLKNLWDDGNVREALVDYLYSLVYPDPAVTRTAELHSWKLFRTPVWDLTLNQFVPHLNDLTYSENIHNHTRPFVSLTICGGYTQDYYELRKPVCEYKDGDEWPWEINRHEGPSTGPGIVYITDVDIFHALTGFIPGTMTLCVYGPLKQDCILCFNQISGKVERRKTVTDAKNTLINTLRSM